MNRIKELREDRDLRQIDLANATGIDKKTLSNYETEKTKPTSDVLIRLADYFDVSVDYLIGRTDITLYEKEGIIKQIESVENLLKSIKVFLKKQ